MLVISAIVIGGGSTQVAFTFTGPVTAASWDPTWFYCSGSDTHGAAVINVAGGILGVTFDDDVFSLDPWDITAAPAGVIAPQSGILG